MAEAGPRGLCLGELYGGTPEEADGLARHCTRQSGTYHGVRQTVYLPAGRGDKRLVGGRADSSDASAHRL